MNTIHANGQTDAQKAKQCPCPTYIDSVDKRYGSSYRACSKQASEKVRCSRGGSWLFSMTVDDQCRQSTGNPG
jgi:hypothetical protein